jgi:hypothetical protein
MQNQGQTFSTIGIRAGFLLKPARSASLLHNPLVSGLFQAIPA